MKSNIDYLPTVDIELLHDGALHVKFFSGSDMESIFPLLSEELNSLRWELLSSGIKDSATAIVYNVLSNWVEQRFVYKLNNEWKVDIVRLVAKKLGYDIVRFNLVSNGSPDFSDTQVCARCLVDKCGNLCPQLKMMPAELIEQFGEVINNELLSSAIEKYKNEIILDVAHIR